MYGCLGPLGHVSLRSLEGVQLERILFDLFLDVRREVAGSLRPFGGRLTIGLAEGPGRERNDSVASRAGLDNGVALSAIVRAPVLFHEDTFRSRLHGLALHVTLPPFQWFLHIVRLDPGLKTGAYGAHSNQSGHKKKLPNRALKLFGNSFWFRPTEIPHQLNY
jgi:hypothetical protein